MHYLIEELRGYHREKAVHLFNLEKGVADLSMRVNFKNRTRTIQALFEPFCNSTEVAHHHNEEIILAELRLTPAPIHRRVEEISGDHQAFDRISGEIQLKIANEAVGLEELRSTINRFIDIYKDHASGEDAIFFPIADQYLKPNQWQAIKKMWK